MPDQYMDVFYKEDFMMRDMIRSFVDKEIMPVRQQIDDDKEHVIVRRILQGLTDWELKRRPFHPSTAEWAPVPLSPWLYCTRNSGGVTAVYVWPPHGYGLGVDARPCGKQPGGVDSEFARDFTGKTSRMACFAMTEPGGAHGGGGCDIENIQPSWNKNRNQAVLEGDEWVINGQKMWASNEGVADLYCVVCTTDRTGG